jgi:hypothetical protein
MPSFLTAIRLYLFVQFGIGEYRSVSQCEDSEAEGAEERGYSRYLYPYEILQQYDDAGKIDSDSGFA